VLPQPAFWAGRRAERLGRFHPPGPELNLRLTCSAAKWPFWISGNPAARAEKVNRAGATPLSLGVPTADGSRLGSAAGVRKIRPCTKQATTSSPVMPLAARWKVRTYLLREIARAIVPGLEEKGQRERYHLGPEDQLALRQVFLAIDRERGRQRERA
jgi:hypothetical protein